MTNGTKVRKYSNYNRIQQVLARAKFQMSGVLATLLLETFIEHDGRLLASTAYARGLCEERQFREWRKNLIEKGWLVWNESQSDKGIYFPGKKLISYINKEKIAQKEIATRESVEKVRSDLNSRIDTKADRSEVLELKARMAKFEDIARRLETATGDPITINKIADQKACAAEMKKLAQSN